jgi:hypothetical protein
METFAGRNRDMQDTFERHVFSELEFTDTGVVIRVKGNGTEDEAIVLNLGYGFNLPKDSDTEVILATSGSDTGLKLALVSIPRNKQRKWKENAGGIQNPTDPEKAVELNEKRVHSTDDNFAVGKGGTLEVISGTVYVRGDIRCSGTVYASNFKGPEPTPGTPNVPGFEE